MIDIHLLCNEITRDDQWSEFVRRCMVESTNQSAWSGLVLCIDRFGTIVPSEVVSGLQPKFSSLSRYFCFTLEPLFYWNCSSLPTLLLHALFLSDRRRKLVALKGAVFPNETFLRRYYGRGKKLTPFLKLIFALLNFVILFFPGLIVRRTFGRYLWRASNQYREISNNNAQQLKT